MLFRFLSELLAPADTTAEVAKPLNVDDIFKELDDESTDKSEDNLDLSPIEKSDEEGDEDKTEKEEEEEVKLEDEEEKTDEELDEISDEVPARKEILKTFPDLFKKYPQIETAIYRERKYTELLPTIEDAKNAVDKSNKFDDFSGSLLDGNLGSVLTSVKAADEGAYGKIVDNYLEDLGKVDKEAYYHVIGNVSKNIIHALIKESRSRNDGDEDGQRLAAAAVILNQFLFASTNFEAPTKYSKGTTQTSEEETKLRSERQQFMAEKLDSAVESVGSKIKNTIKSTIANNIDPRGSMTDYVKKIAISDAMDDVQKLISKDTRFKATYDKLWSRAAEKNFNNESMNAIKSAYFNKAKALLPSVIKTHRNAALKGLGKRTDERVTKDREEKEEKVEQRRSTPARRSNESTDKPQKRMSTLDYLNAD